MRPAVRSVLASLLAAAAFACAAHGMADYALTAPAPQLDPELSPRHSLLALGPLQLAAATSMTGNGLSLQAGEQWFARAGIGRSLEADVLSVGGGYKFHGGQALSMHVTRQLGQERLGLAVRYDWSRSYLRLAYESPLRPLSGSPDTLRFSAGVRF